MEKGQKQDVSTARCVTVASVIHTYLFFYRVVSRNIYSNVHKFTHNTLQMFPKQTRHRRGVFLRHSFPKSGSSNQ